MPISFFVSLLRSALILVTSVEISTGQWYENVSIIACDSEKPMECSLASLSSTVAKILEIDLWFICSGKQNKSYLDCWVTVWRTAALESGPGPTAALCKWEINFYSMMSMRIGACCFCILINRTRLIIMVPFSVPVTKKNFMWLREFEIVCYFTLFLSIYRNMTTDNI